jgi:hypothetical protein
LAPGKRKVVEGLITAARQFPLSTLSEGVTHADAVFNLAQLRMKSGQMGVANSLHERILTLDQPADRAATARKAITHCSARLSA